MDFVENEKDRVGKHTDKQFIAQVGIVILLAGVLAYSFFGPGFGSGNAIGTVSASGIIPTGIPAVYGKELGVSYNDVSPNNQAKADATINLLGNIDRVENLQGTDLQRYINILYNMDNGISCEYCCGARSIIFSDGSLACGCAHSYAMRGLAKYLIKYHGSEFTDEQILTELGKWKTLFFPDIMQGKARVLQQNGIELNYINLASNKYRGIEQGQTNGGMIGEC
jgi:hypothetical protein